VNKLANLIVQILSSREAILSHAPLGLLATTKEKLDEDYFSLRFEAGHISFSPSQIDFAQVQIVSSLIYNIYPCNQTKEAKKSDIVF